MTRLLPIVLVTIVLAGCSRSEPDAPPETNIVATRALPPVKSSSPVARPVRTPRASPASNESAELPPPADVGEDEQMLDDASATGMTAHVQRDEDAGEPMLANSEAEQEEPRP